MKIFLSGFLCVLILTACISEDENLSFTAAELTKLLAADSSNSWLLTSRLPGPALDDCEIDDRITFRLSTSPEDTITLIYETGLLLCPGQADSVGYQGQWTLLDGSQTDSILFIVAGDTSRRAIAVITSQTLELTYLQGSSYITEVFADHP